MKGAIPIEKRTISGRISKKHSLPHNNREFLCENVDPTRTKDNITIIKDDIGQVYHELFDNALIEYNAKQKRKDRIIKDYHEHIRHSRQELLNEVEDTIDKLDSEYQEKKEAVGH